MELRCAEAHREDRRIVSRTVMEEKRNAETRKIAEGNKREGVREQMGVSTTGASLQNPARKDLHARATATSN